MAIDISPRPHSLKSQRTGRKTYHLLVAEAIDNSLDADALMIDINIDQHKVQIIDDGRGLTRDNIAAPFAEGHHAPSSSTALGQFGIGITKQARHHGNILLVDTVSMDGVRLKLQADWKRVEESGQWTLPDPDRLSYVGPRYTKVMIGGLYKPPTAKDIERVREEISLRFYPALADGKRIQINKEILTPLNEPAMVNIVEEMIDMGDGRLALVRGGLLKNPYSTNLYGVNVSFRHRVIKTNSGFGCAGYSGLNGMFARVELNGAWQLTSFKDDIDDDDLEEAVQDILRPILKKCHSLSRTANTRELLDAMYRMLGDRSARPNKRQRLNRKGKKLGRQGIVKIPAPPGPAKSKHGRGGKITIEFVPGAQFHSDYGIGEASRASKRDHRIRLAEADPTISYWLNTEKRNVDDAAKALMDIAMCLYVQSDRQGNFDEYGKRVSDQLSLQDQGKAEAA